MSKEKCYCIICKKIKESSIEHIIPESLGNQRFITKNVCETCNNRLGGRVEKIISDIPLNRFYAKGDIRNKTAKNRIKILEGIFSSKNIEATKIEYLKIAYEFAHLVWGDEYLEDDIAKELSKILNSIVENTEYVYNLDDYIISLPNGKFYEESEAIEEEVMHCVRMVYNDSTCYVNIELHCNQILADSVLVKVTRNRERYQESKNTLQIRKNGKNIFL